MYMPVIDIPQTAGTRTLRGVPKSEKQPLAYEVCWDEYMPRGGSLYETHRGRRFSSGELVSGRRLVAAERRPRLGETRRSTAGCSTWGRPSSRPDRPELPIRYLESKGSRVAAMTAKINGCRPLRGGDGGFAQSFCGDLMRRLPETMRGATAGSGGRWHRLLIRYHDFDIFGACEVVPQPLRSSCGACAIIHLKCSTRIDGPRRANMRVF